MRVYVRVCVRVKDYIYIYVYERYERENFVLILGGFVGACRLTQRH